MSAEFLRPDWPAPAGVRAAFSWRSGGVSAPPCDSFNLATHVGDDPTAVRANRATLRAALQLPQEPQWLQQVHGNGVLTAVAPGAATTQAAVAALATELATTPAIVPVADAAVTRAKGVPLVIMVADCLPVLLASRDGSVVGAAHAGWRGLADGVIEATVAAMAVPGSELLAWLGPCIRRASFEVGEVVRTAFSAASGAEPDELTERADTLAAFSANSRGRWQCDLAALARLRLRRAGVTAVTDSGICTHADRARCFSHRRDGRTGRMAALLWLQP